MARVLVVAFVATLIPDICAAPGPKRYSGYATASNGSIAVGHVAGGKFQSGAFSIGHGGNSAGTGSGGHGGNQGSITYGGQGGDSGHTSYS